MWIYREYILGNNKQPDYSIPIFHTTEEEIEGLTGKRLPLPENRKQGSRVYIRSTGRRDVYLEWEEND